jgi:hypothetical protein
MKEEDKLAVILVHSMQRPARIIKHTILSKLGVSPFHDNIDVILVVEYLAA